MRLAFKQFTSFANSQSITVDDLDYRAVLILHGLFGSKRNWQSIAKAMLQQFNKKYTIFTLDLRNHGESGHMDSMSYQEMADDVLQFMHEYKLQDVIIIGHSMGGKVAMQMALQAPHLIKCMVILDIAPIQYKHDFSQFIYAMLGLPLNKLSSRSDADQHLQPRIESAKIRQFLLQNLYKSNSGFYWGINLQAIQSCLPDILDFPTTLTHVNPCYQGPVLFLKGENSDYIQSNSEPRIFEIFPKAQFITIAGTSHWLHVENPPLVIQEIARFIAKN